MADGDPTHTEFVRVLRGLSDQLREHIPKHFSRARERWWHRDSPDVLMVVHARKAAVTIDPDGRRCHAAVDFKDDTIDSIEDQHRAVPLVIERDYEAAPRAGFAAGFSLHVDGGERFGLMPDGRVSDKTPIRGETLGLVADAIVAAAKRRREA